MIEMEFSHCQTVQSSLSGGGEINEQTFASLEVLADRLGRVKNLGGAFAGIEFSPDVKGLLKQKKAVAVG